MDKSQDEVSRLVRRIQELEAENKWLRATLLIRRNHARELSTAFRVLRDKVQLTVVDTPDDSLGKPANDL